MGRQFQRGSPVEFWIYHLDPRQYNGGVFLGLNGIAVKSHGGTDATGFAAAIGLAADMAAERITDKIIADFKLFRAGLPAAPKAALN